MNSPNSISNWLRSHQNGDAQIRNQLGQWLVDVVRRRVERMARRKYVPDSVTAITDMVILKLIRSQIFDQAPNEGFVHAATIQAIREIVAESARYHSRKKRNAVPNDPLLQEYFGDLTLDRSTDLLDLEDAMKELSQKHPRGHDVVVLRYYLSMTVQQTASELGISVSTVEEDWRKARVWLFRKLAGPPLAK